MLRRRLLAAVLCVLLPSLAAAQALTSLSSLRVRYNTQKATVQPTGDLKVQIDEVDRQLADATRVGNTGEIRRLLAKGTTLLAGRPWTPETDYASSLVIRTDRLVVDSGRPYTVRLEQIYMPAIELTRSLRASAVLRSPASPPNAGGQSDRYVRDLGSVSGVGRDLRESPFFLDLNMAGVPDGNYQLSVEVLDQTKSLGTATLAINVRSGLDDLVARLERGAAQAPEAVRADILYPIDRMRMVNRGSLELRTFDPAGDFAEAEAVLNGSRSGADPFKTRTGDFKRHYLLESAGEIMPYRMYVPSKYDGTRAYPLIIALHGLGGTEDSFFTNYGGAFPKLAEERGYILAAPLGYRVDGFYGWGVGNPPADPVARDLRERSEQDVMEVLKRVRQQYNVDPNRIYLAGHSMGGIGTWQIGPKYPDIWAAMAPFAGQGSPASVERIRNVPQYVVHGDDDRTVNVQGSRSMVARMKELGMTVQYVEVPGGGHSDVVQPNAKGMFDFFDKHKK